MASARVWPLAEDVRCSPLGAARAVPSSAPNVSAAAPPGVDVRTIRSTSDVDRLFKQGRRSPHPLVIVLVAPSPEARDQAGRVVFVAGRKLGNAVTRNRCKRVLRASLRRVGREWPGLDVALIARAGTATAPAQELDSALRQSLARSGVTG